MASARVGRERSFADKAAVVLVWRDQLSQYEGRPGRQAPPLRIALTPRERQVLQLTADGFEKASDREGAIH
jgi:DNA-binding NarL/FixJ family response regulator